ncbi:MAG: hypothetical protein R2710_14960 [Acidimicrobiales bacterium]
MDRQSGRAVAGDVAVRGSKNGVTKHMVAAMLADTPSRISNCPDVGDVAITAGMLEALGCGSRSSTAWPMSTLASSSRVVFRCGSPASIASRS